MAEQKAMRNLEFDGAWPAGELAPGKLVCVEGHVVDVRADPADPQRVRLILVPAFGIPPDEDRPDRREIELSCPRDMLLGTLRPENFELVPPPARPAEVDHR
jgi:hypothetical protein